MPQEEADLSLADFGVPKRPYTAPVPEATAANENAPATSGWGIHFSWSTRPDSNW
jgi:hypothetical protein